MNKRIVFVLLFVLIMVFVSAGTILAFFLPYSPSHIYPSVWPSQFATPTPLIVQTANISGRLFILNRELGIPLEQLKTMSAEQIQDLFEKNAQRLQVNISKLVTTTPGTEFWITIQGRRSATPSESPAQIPLHISANCPSGQCSSTFLPIAAVAAPLSTNCPTIQQGLAFLNARYNSTVGLLNESPNTFPNRYWLTNDNALAAYAFSQLGQPEMSVTLTASMQNYGYSTNGLIEVVWGVPVSFPPFDAKKTVIATPGSNEVWQEFHNQGSLMVDWAEYSNLGFLAAVNEYYRGNVAESLSIYSSTLAQFDGIGFVDKSYLVNNKYETYKLALALYAGKTIHASIPTGDQILKILLAMQSADGGFTTHYFDLNTPDGDKNTETTAFAILAQSVYGCTAP